MKLIQITNGKPTTTSLQVAEFFKKDHSKILRDIRSILDQETKANFGLSNYKDKSGKENLMYIIDKDGFTLLAMGFTGKKAFEFKKSYIKAFNAMEKELSKPKQLSTLDLLKLNQKAIEQLEQRAKELETENTKLANRDLEVKTQKDYKWKEKELRADRGRTINYYVTRHFFEGNYKEAHDKAKLAYKSNTGVNLPMSEKLMSLDQKKDYLNWLSKFS